MRSVQLILTNQNTPIGYAAETNLCLGIIDRFGSVPWKRRLREAYEKDLANDTAIISGTQSPPTSKADMQKDTS